MLSVVSMGFTESEVLDMPLNKVLIYADGFKRRVALERQATFSDLTNAIGSALSGKGFTEYIKKLGETDG